jgi:hypothetical protein
MLGIEMQIGGDLGDNNFFIVDLSFNDLFVFLVFDVVQLVFGHLFNIICPDVFLLSLGLVLGGLQSAIMLRS